MTPFFPLRARFESVKSLGYAATGRQPRMKSSIQSEELTPAVGKLIYSAITSLDGYIEDENGNFDWAEPDEEVFAFVNEIERPIGTYLYGRRMYETMAGWETDEFIGDRRPVIVDFANIWRAADKIVFSRTLESVSTARTRIEASFDPDLIQKIKSSTKSDLTVAGAELAALAFRMMGVYRRFATAKMWRRWITDKAAFARSIEEILGWDFTRIVVAHGDVVDRDARDQFESALRELDLIE